MYCRIIAGPRWKGPHRALWACGATSHILLTFPYRIAMHFDCSVKPCRHFLLVSLPTRHIILVASLVCTFGHTVDLRWDSQELFSCLAASHEPAQSACFYDVLSSLNCFLLCPPPPPLSFLYCPFILVVRELKSLMKIVLVIVHVFKNILIR